MTCFLSRLLEMIGYYFSEETNYLKILNPHLLIYANQMSGQFFLWFPSFRGLGELILTLLTCTASSVCLLSSCGLYNEKKH